MRGLQNTLENLILRKLSQYHAIGEHNLYEMCRGKSGVTFDKLYAKAIAKLYMKGMIDIINDPTDSIKIVRVRTVYQ